MSDQSSQIDVVSGVSVTTGSYIEFPIVDLSYYPSEGLYDRVKTILYGAHPVDSVRWQMAQEEDRVVPISRPFANTKVQGTFMLFLPAHERPWGMMEVSQLKPIGKREHDLTLALIPALAVMPFKLYISSGQVWEREKKQVGKFYVVDREGSRWSVHCH